MPPKTFAPNLRVSLEPLITPLYRTWWRASRGMTLGVRGIAQDESGAVLLVRHTYRSGWYLPGGGVETGETLAEAAIKEMAEEAGVHALAPPRLFSVYSNHARFKNDHVALFIFDQWEKGASANDGEIAEIGWFARNALPEATTSGTRTRLREVFEGGEIDSYW
jgi:ADP-ribose pyrophosphatase YjhB (NUDIX family)